MLIAGTGGQIIGPYLYFVGREVVKLAGHVPWEVQLQKQLLSAEHDRPGFMFLVFCFMFTMSHISFYLILKVAYIP